MTFDLEAHLKRQRDWSRKTFGPGDRTKGVTDHIAKELEEIRAAPGDLAEWIDVVILAFDGAWRAGFGPDEIIEALVAKQTKNEGRKWPDWRSADKDKAIEHVKPMTPWQKEVTEWKETGQPRPHKRSDGWPTRSAIEWWSDAENAISEAMMAVEDAGASVALTDAITLLAKARDRVADHVEGRTDPAS